MKNTNMNQNQNFVVRILSQKEHTQELTRLLGKLDVAYREIALIEEQVVNESEYDPIRGKIKHYRDGQWV